MRKGTETNISMNFYLPSEVASGTEVLKICCEPFIDVAQSQLSCRRLKENCLNSEIVKENIKKNITLTHA